MGRPLKLVVAIAAVALAATGITSPAWATGGVTVTNQTYSTFVNQTLPVDAPGVLTGATSTNGGALQAALQTAPNRGTVSIQPNGAFTFTPARDFTGPMTFQYYAVDGLGGRDIGTVTINVEQTTPQVGVDNYSVGTGLYLNVSAPGLLANDFDPGAQRISVASVTQPANGSLSACSDGSFTYISNAGFEGSDSFTYEVSNGAVSATGTARIAVSKAGPGDSAASGICGPAGASTAPAVTGSVAALPGLGGAVVGDAGGAGSASGGGSAGSGASGGSASSTPDLAVSAKKTRSGNRSVVRAAVANLGGAAAPAPVKVTATLSKGVTLVKATSPVAWTCTIAKRVLTCKSAKPLAASAVANFSYTVTSKKGKKRTVRVAASATGDNVASNDFVVVPVPAKK